MEPADAVDHAQNYIFTYDDLPKGARRIRDYGISVLLPTPIRRSRAAAHRLTHLCAWLHRLPCCGLQMLPPAPSVQGMMTTSGDESLQRYIKDPHSAPRPKRAKSSSANCCRNG